MDILSSFIPLDRRRALIAGEDLPARAEGAALFADIGGFTPLTEALAGALGPQRGAEELTVILNRVYDALIGVIHGHGGSVIGFAGDAITCWFAGDDGTQAGSAALALQAAMAAFQAIPVPGGGTHALALKVGLAAGPARRFIVGDPAIQQIDVLAGATVGRMAAAEHLAHPGEIVLSAECPVPSDGWRVTGDENTNEEAVIEGRAGFRVLKIDPIHASRIPHPASPSTQLLTTPHSALRTQDFILPAVYRRLVHGGGTFLTELRPAVALFLRFGGLDYDHDPAAPARLDAYVRWVQAILARTGGNLIQLTVGDKGNYLYAAFGAPLAHGDDAARAVQAALELHAAPPPATGIGPGQVGISLGQARVGIYGGAGSHTYGVLGDATNAAARLMQAAAPGEVLVSAEAQRATGRRFAWAGPAPLQVKGKAAPLAVYTLQGLQTGAEQGMLEPQWTTPLVGRAAERAAIATRLALAQAGQGQVPAITGEAGLGKSRLVAVTMAQARAAGWAVYGGAAESTGMATPYLAWAAVWRGFFGLAAPDAPPAAQAAQVATQLAALDPALAPRLPLLGPLLGLALPDTELTASMDAGLRKTSLESLLVESLRARAQATPVLLVLEDAHWLDALSYDLLEAVALAAARLPVALLLAYRPIERPPAPLARVAGLPYFAELRLTDLPPADAAALVAARLGGEDGAAPSPPLVAALTARAGGNPFYLEELLNYLTERGIDLRDAAALARLDWPTSLQSLLLARIDQLTEDQRTVLKVASIVGRLFYARQLWGVHPGLGAAAAVRAALAELDRLGLVPLDRPEPDPAYLFKHMVTHDVTYQSLPHSLRARLHEQFAAWLEAEAAAGRSVPVDVLAYHYGQTTNAAKQIAYYRQAADAAVAAYANATAVEYYERLLPLLPAGAQRAVLQALGDVLERTGAWDAAAARYEAARAEAAASGDRAALAAAAYGLSVVRERQGAMPEAEQWGRQAQAEYAAAGDLGGESAALAQLGEIYRVQSQFPAAQAALQAAVERAVAAGDRSRQAQALHRLGLATWQHSEGRSGPELFTESLALLRALGDRRGIAQVLMSMAKVIQNEHAAAATQALYEEALTLFRELGDRLGATQTLNNLGTLFWTRGALPQARALYEESLALKRDLGDRRGIGIVLSNLSNLAQIEGDLALARRLGEESLALLRGLGVRGTTANVLTELARVAWKQADLAAAQVYAAEALALYQELNSAISGLDVLVITAGLLPAGPLPVRFLGAATRRAAAEKHPFSDFVDQPTYDAVQAALQAALGGPAFAAAFAEGETLAVPDALAEALAELKPHDIANRSGPR